MRILRKALLTILFITFVIAVAGCSRTSKDITVDRHVTGEEFIVE